MRYLTNEKLTATIVNGLKSLKIVMNIHIRGIADEYSMKKEVLVKLHVIFDYIMQWIKYCLIGVLCFSSCGYKETIFKFEKSDIEIDYKSHDVVVSANMPMFGVRVVYDTGGSNMETISDYPLELKGEWYVLRYEPKKRRFLSLLMRTHLEKIGR